MTDAREIIALQEFAKWAIKEGAFLAADLDSLSIHEKAHELGLIEATAYDPEKHGPSDCAEPGGERFVLSPLLSARPSEQVVTEAMVEAVRKLILDDVDVWLSDDTIRGALKAAMEAGR